jgi:hypothetical protein
MWDYIVRKFLMDLIKFIKDDILFYVCLRAYVDLFSFWGLKQISLRIKFLNT